MLAGSLLYCLSTCLLALNKIKPLLSDEAHLNKQKFDWHSSKVLSPSKYQLIQIQHSDCLYFN